MRKICKKEKKCKKKDSVIFSKTVFRTKSCLDNKKELPFITFCMNPYEIFS